MGGVTKICAGGLTYNSFLPLEHPFQPKGKNLPSDVSGSELGPFPDLADETPSNGVGDRGLWALTDQFTIPSCRVSFFLRDLRFLVWKCNMEQSRLFFLSPSGCVNPPYPSQRDRRYLDER